MKKVATILTLALLLLAGTTFAGPAKLSDIPESSKWAVHVDIASVRDSVLAGEIMKIVTGKNAPVPEGEIAKAKEVWNQLADVESITFFGPSKDEKTVGAIIKATKYDKAAAMKLFKITDTTVTKPGDGHEYLSGKDDVFCFYNQTTVISGGSIETAKAITSMLDGKGKSLAPNSVIAGMLKKSAKGSLIVAAIGDSSDIFKINQAENAAVPQALLVLSKIREAKIEVCEVDSKVSVTVKLAFIDEETATEIKKMAEGLVAMTSMMLQQQEKAMPNPLDGLKITQDGKIISANISSSVKDILALITPTFTHKETPHDHDDKDTSSDAHKGHDH